MIRALFAAAALAMNASAFEFQQVDPAKPAPRPTATSGRRENQSGEEDIRKKKFGDWGWVQLKVDGPCYPPECKIQVDTTLLRPFGPPPNTRDVRLEKGNHSLTVVVDGAQVEEQRFEVTKQNRTVLALTLPRRSATAEVKEGSLTVVVEKPSKVRINQTTHEVRDEETFRLPFGEYSVQLLSGTEAKSHRAAISAQRPNAVMIFVDPPAVPAPATVPAPTPVLAAPPAPPASPAPPVGGEIEWQTIARGTMQLGCITGDQFCQPDERSRPTTLETFRIMTTEVTVGRFESWLKKKGRGAIERPEWTVTIPVGELAIHPAVRVTWRDAQAFCQEEAGGRLPKEDEWEFAVRQNRPTSVFSWDPEMDKYLAGGGPRRSRAGDGDAPIVNVADESASRENPNWKTIPGYDDGFPYTAPAKTTKAIKGVHDLVGNVWEWMQDDMVGKPGRKVVRGGSFSSPPPHTLRSSHRASLEADDVREDVGFRCVKP